MALRDALFTEDQETLGVLARLRTAGLQQAMWLATCDRVELWAADAVPAGAADRAVRVLAGTLGMACAELSARLYCHLGDDATRHAFAVAASLDSHLLGEPFVLGQVKAAFRLAEGAGTIGPELAVLMQAAFAAAKRVRTETRIAERPTSIASAAIQAVRELHGDLAACRGMVTGLGDMGLFLAEQFRGAGLGAVTIIATAERRAVAAAARLGCHFAPMAALEETLVASDVVIGAAGLGHALFCPDLVGTVLRRRRRRPIFLIDVAVPPDVDTAVQSLDDAFVYTLDDLERVALQGRQQRETEATAAWSVLDDAFAGFLRTRAARAAVPTVVALRRHFESVRDDLLAERTALDAAESTRLLVNRLLHRPSARLRDLAGDDSSAGIAERQSMERAMRHLFDLEDSVTTPRPPEETES